MCFRFGWNEKSTIEVGKLLCESFWRSIFMPKPIVLTKQHCSISEYEPKKKFHIEKHPIRNVIKSVQTADGVITIKSANVQKVIWDNIVKQHYVIRNVWMEEFVQRRQYVHAQKVIRVDIAKEVIYWHSKITLFLTFHLNLLVGWILLYLLSITIISFNPHLKFII